LARHLMERVSSPNVSLYDVLGKTPGQLKFVLGKSEAVLTSRFHAMIAALSSCVPVVVTSWSHKYREVLSMFELEAWGIHWGEMHADEVVALVSRALAERRSISEAIAHRPPRITREAERNFESVLELAL